VEVLKKNSFKDNIKVAVRECLLPFLWGFRGAVSKTFDLLSKFILCHYYYNSFRMALALYLTPHFN